MTRRSSQLRRFRGSLNVGSGVFGVSRLRCGGRALGRRNCKKALGTGLNFAFLRTDAIFPLPERVLHRPDAVEPFPDAVFPRPDAVKWGPDAVEAPPDAVEGVPDAVEACPDAVRGTPPSFRRNIYPANGLHALKEG
jgi:hypothetical protein